MKFKCPLYRSRGDNVNVCHAIGLLPVTTITTQFLWQRFQKCLTNLKKSSYPAGCLWLVWCLVFGLEFLDDRLEFPEPDWQSDNWPLPDDGFSFALSSEARASFSLLLLRGLRQEKFEPTEEQKKNISCDILTSPFSLKTGWSHFKYYFLTMW